MRNIESKSLSQFLDSILSEFLDAMSLLTSSVFTLWGLAQILSGAAVFYGGGALLAPYMARERVLIPIAAFTFVVPMCFAALTVGWYRLHRKRKRVPRPDLNLIIGALVFMPLYFEAASLFIHKPRPLIPREIIENVLVYYLTFPYSLTLLSGYTGTGLGLGAAIVATLVIGELMRREGLRIAQHRPA